MNRAPVRFLACLLLLFACGKRDPFDVATIEKDLKKHSAQDLYEKLDKAKYDPPADRLLTHHQLQDYVRLTRLATKIMQVAAHEVGEQTDRAAAAEDRLTRLGEGLAALGAFRAYATAPLRASINLGLNPREEQWVAQQISAAVQILTARKPFDKAVEERKADVDNEIDPVLANYKRHDYENAVAALEAWEQSRDPAALANSKLIQQHSIELKEAIPGLD